jgi:glutathione S-transferase
MKKLELYYFDECPYCQIVLKALQETGVNAELKHIRKDPKNREKLLADTGRGTVPCLYIDGKPMHESGDIARWLRDYAKNPT